MKTIAISIDEESVEAIDRLARATGRRRGGRRQANRSELIRQAVREFLARQQGPEREEGDRRVLGTHRELVGRQANVLVAEQAKR